ncbi:ATP-binding protein [Streptomyces sp. NBC_01335]|uniref:ATP-binding protein n=1 Tax=Streptomyces sp. NBC_01335 TaxID=2903828 RepID=UPI002E0F0762|nr:ATP-binding protein [Streptomyces sp. NBC_01335]
MPIPTQNPPPAPLSWAVPRAVEDGSVRLSVSFPPGPHRVKAMRQLAGRLLRQSNLDDELIGTVELLVSELVTNAVVHGHGKEVRFSLAYVDGSDVLIEVDDRSPAPLRVRYPSPEQESGRGLLLVDALARAWGRWGSCTWCAVSTQQVRV